MNWNRGIKLQIEGQIVDIIYKNEVNSYTVATFETTEKEEVEGEVILTGGPNRCTRKRALMTCG